MAKNALEGARSWNQMIPSYSNQKGAAAWNDDGGWLAHGSNSLYFETYIDLAGYEREDLTLVPMEAAIQDPGLYSGGRVTDPLWVMDVISQVRLPANTISTMLTAGLNEYNNAPGMSGQTQDFNQITMGQLRIMGNSTLTTATAATLPPWITQNNSSFGSGAPVTVQRLWVYRFVYLVATVGLPLNIPASRILLRGMVTKESDLVYIQRLRRSYELQQLV